ncbi:penicillin-binding protein [Microbacterium capsulatum]|uniref:Penicillin-binding protein n=1 Tax=Microbacterium capsulatum TaxID=3041921 RepID=A0ABU0XI85_9MICO|nr:penicillin-binding protein [Microbacterium sp. ASV81]MDQ4214384.1 penicillin-binding protein [Microbacterium sp. ASV81]
MPQTKRTLTSVLSGLAGLVGLSVVAGVLVTASVTPVFAVTGAAATQSIDLFENLPSNLKVDRPMEATTIYGVDANGQPQQIARFFDQNRVPVTYNQVAMVLYDALLSSEDKNYYSHGGVDLVGTLKAVVGNVTGSSSAGGSSISQQYVKNVLLQECEQGVPLSDQNRDDKLNQCWNDAAATVGSKGIARKLQEIRYATAIEKKYSKNDILVGYLNLANFGGTSYGIQAAAQHYFGVSASQLSLVQAATLAGMVQNPNAYRIDQPNGSIYDADTKTYSNSAKDGYKDTLVRRNYVLGRMLANGKITKAAYDAAHAQPITPNIVNPPSGCGMAGDNAYFCRYVQTTLEGDHSLDSVLGSSKAERQDKLFRGGLNVYTSLSYPLQGAAVQAMHDNTTPTVAGMSFGAATVNIEASTGRILSLTQNTNYSEEKSDTATTGQSSLVYAADYEHGGSSGFSVGSTYKVFTLIDWLEKGHSLRETVNGSIQRQTMNCHGTPVPMTSDVANAGGNRGFVGTPLAFTAYSLNSGFLAMAAKLDLCDINAVADRMGVHLGNMGKTTDQNVPFDVLGSKAIAPIEMAAVYATLANNGTRCAPHAIDRITGADGADLKLPPTTCTQVIKPEIAATAAYALRGVMSNGATGITAAATGAQGNPNDGTQLIGKTGTHNNAQTMLIESSTKVVTAVWVGQSIGDVDINDFDSNGNNVPYIRFYLGKAIQGAADSLFSGSKFPDPAQNLLKQSYTNLPSVIGQTIDQATQTLQGAGFSVTVGPAVASNLPTDQVAAQDPGPGQVATGSVVTISPSNGQGTAVPTDLVGKSLTDAATELQKLGFQAAKGACTPSGKDDNGTVTATTPAGGTFAPKGSVVALNYSAKNCQQ